MLMWQFWLIVAGVFLIAEIFTTGFLIFWVGIGALFAMLSSFVTDNVIIQTKVFVIASALFILLTRPLVKKYVAKDQDNVVTNAKAIIGKTGVVTQNISKIEGAGLVKIGEEVWSAISNSCDEIKKGTEIKVLDIEGVKLVVDPIDIKSETEQVN